MALSGSQITSAGGWGPHQAYSGFTAKAEDVGTWTLLSDNATTWTATTDNSDAWTVVTDGSDAWTEQ